MASGETDVRERIVQTALGLLREGGIKRLSQVQVARVSGIPQGHLTYYFPKKNDLVAELMRRFSDDAIRELSAIVGGGEAAARREGFEMIRRLAHDRERTRMLVGLLVEAEQDPALRAALADNTNHARAGLAALLGMAPDGLEIELVLCAYWGIGLMHLLYQGIRDDARTDALLTLVASGLERDRRQRAPESAPTRTTKRAPKRTIKRTTKRTTKRRRA